MNTQEQIRRALEVSDLAQFSFREYEISGDIVILCNPRANEKINWVKENLILRSCIYRKSDFAPISLGYKKFFNNLERPDLDQLPEDIKQIKWASKMDGSLILVSKPKTNFPLFIRTRGSAEILHHATGKEVLDLVSKYELDTIFQGREGQFTLLFENITPSHTIVVKYPYPDLILIGMIFHYDYTLCSQNKLDEFALHYGLKRPKFYEFNSYQTALESIKKFDSEEGCVCYYNGDQSLIKVKGEWYCRLHSLKSSYGSYNKLIEEFLIYQNSAFQGCFFYYIEKLTDFEVASFCREKIEVIENANRKLNGITDAIEIFCNREWQTRKEFALAAKQEFSPDIINYAFEIKDKKEISSKSRQRFLETEVRSLVGCKEVETARD